MAHRSVAALVSLALLAGCQKAEEATLPPGQYKIGLHEAFERLAKSDFADFMFERQCGILVHLKTYPHPERAVFWRIFSSGKEMVSFTATLSAVSATETKVDISVSKEPDGTEAYDGTKFYKWPALKQPLRPAINEQVAALFEGRPYDVYNVTQQPKDTVCLVQRGGLESGMRFSIND